MEGNNFTIHFSITILGQTADIIQALACQKLLYNVRGIETNTIGITNVVGRHGAVGKVLLGLAGDAFHR